MLVRRGALMNGLQLLRKSVTSSLRFTVLLMLANVLYAQPVSRFLISTVAGSGELGEGGPATAAWLLSPTDVAVDSQGNIYLVDQSADHIRKVARDGTITTVAGTGDFGFGGDGGPAIAAQLSGPTAIALDTLDNLYIADRGNGRIRKVTPAGIISTVAVGSSHGVAVDSSGNVYYTRNVPDCGVLKLTPAGTATTVAGSGTCGYSGDDGPATAAQLGWLEHGLAVDRTGNLYIVDDLRIRKVTPDGIIRTVAGTGRQGNSGDGGPATSGLLNLPEGLAVDGQGNLYIADSQNNSIRKVTPAGIITTVAGRLTSNFGFSGDGGPAKTAELAYPHGVALDASGNLYIADTGNQRIRKVLPNGTISTVAGRDPGGFSGDGGPATAAQLHGPLGTVVDASGNLYIADRENQRVRKVTPGGIISTVAGTGVPNVVPVGDGGLATAASLFYPRSVAVDRSGNLFIVDENTRIRKVTPEGVIGTLATVSATSVAVDSAGNIYAGNSLNPQVFRITPAGAMTRVAGTGKSGFSGDGGPATSAELEPVSAIAFDPSGNLYIAGGRRIRKMTPEGVISTVAGGGRFLYMCGQTGSATEADFPAGLSGVAADASGNLYVGDRALARILRITPVGVVTTVAGNCHGGFGGDGGPATSARLSDSNVSAIDPSGNLYIADSESHRIRKLTVTQSPENCSYSIEPGSQWFDSSGGRGSVGVTAPSGCGWLAGSNSGWITLSSNAGGSGGGSVTFTVAPNSSGWSRIGTLAIAGRTFTVTQANVGCSLSINPGTASVPAEGGKGNVAVTANLPGCSWTASINVNWVTITSGAQGVGNGTVSYSVAANGGGQRTGAITIGGQTFTVTQAQSASAVVISAEGIVNAASGVAGGVAPGEFISIYGSRLGPAEPVISGSLEKSLAGTRVFVNGIEAFLTYASSGQVNALVPYATAPGKSAALQVEYEGTKSNTIVLSAVEAAPGIYTMNGSGMGAAVVLNQDGKFNSDANPAPKGSVVVFWATGQGQTDPQGVDGQQPEGPAFPKPRLPLLVSIGGFAIAPEDMLFCGLIYAGVMQVNVRIPAAAPSGGAVELLLTVGSSTSRTRVTLAVE